MNFGTLIGLILALLTGILIGFAVWAPRERRAAPRPELEPSPAWAGPAHPPRPGSPSDKRQQLVKAARLALERPMPTIEEASDALSSAANFIVLAIDTLSRPEIPNNLPPVPQTRKSPSP